MCPLLLSFFLFDLLCRSLYFDSLGFFQLFIALCLVFFKTRFQYVNVLLFPFGVENNGFEPLTPCLQSRCSSQLS